MLSLAARLYAAVMRLRNAAYDRVLFRTHSVSVPVISVGNITAGGTGKTPVVEYLLAYCLEQGWRPAVVTRGYRRRSRGLVLVSDGAGIRVTADQSGDEAAQIARKFPQAIVIADANRVRGARHAVASCGAEVILLDDAFQHRAIGRNCDIVVIDAQQDLAAQRMIPAGRLREPLDHLRRADIVLLSRCDSAEDCTETAASLRRWTEAPVYQTTFRAAALQRLSLNPAGKETHGASASSTDVETHGAATTDTWSEARTALPPDALAGRRVTAFCGIGSPQSFRRLLTDLGMEIDAFHSMGDHHWYTPRELRRLVHDAVQRTGGLLLTTEKDAARLGDEGWINDMLAELSSADVSRTSAARSAKGRIDGAEDGEGRVNGIYYPVLRMEILNGEDAFLTGIRRNLSR